MSSDEDSGSEDESNSSGISRSSDSTVNGVEQVDNIRAMHGYAAIAMSKYGGGKLVRSERLVLLKCDDDSALHVVARTYAVVYVVMVMLISL